IDKLDKANRDTDDIVGKRTSGSGKLSVSDTFSSGDYQRRSTRTYADNGRLASAKAYTDITNTLSDDSAFEYDNMGRQTKSTSPGGTITRKTYDARGHVLTVSVGTQEESESPPHDSNMLTVEEYEYDSGSAGGDGNLTKITRWVDSNSSNKRVTTFGYDWRNRKTFEDGEVDSYTEYTCDNFDRVTQVDRRNTNSSGHLIGRTQ